MMQEQRRRATEERKREGERQTEIREIDRSIDGEILKE